MLHMISLIVLLVCSINFVYLDWWAASDKYRYCAVKDLPLKTPQAPVAATFIGFVFFLSSIGWSFWGVTDNPYHQGKGWWLHAGGEYSGYLMLLNAFCMGSLVYVPYRLGVIATAVEMRKEQYLFDWNKETTEEVTRLMESEGTAAANAYWQKRSETKFEFK
jgi:hypothetical protein